MDWLMFAVAAGLAFFGAMMVYSASAMIANRETSGASQFTYFYKQIAFTIAGVGIMLAASRIDYHRYQNVYVVAGVLALTVAGLVAVFSFPEINGARRWLRFGSFSVQPSELAKIALPLFLGYFLTVRESRVGEIKAAVLPSMAVLTFLGGLILLEPDLGTVVILCAIFATVYFAAGARILHLTAVGVLMLAAGLAALLFAPWRMERLMAFVDPFEHADDAGYQVVQSLYAIGSGGIFGEGFAKGQAKLFYLPYPYSDFIFSVVGEELGLIGTMAVLAAFGILLWRGARAAILARDRFGMLLGIGLITAIVVQALFNISVVISLLPAKGIPLPFISYGGSSVLVTLFAVGVMLNISRQPISGSDDKGQVATGRPSNVRRRRSSPLKGKRS